MSEIPKLLHIPPPSRRQFLQFLGLASVTALGLKTDTSGQQSEPNINPNESIYAGTIGATSVNDGQNKITSDVSKSEQTPPPPDTISSQELLEKWNTRIWNTPSVQLFLRKEAVEKEPIFQDLSMFPPYKGHLDIVLIDGAVARSEFLTPEEKKAMPQLLGSLQYSEKLQDEKAGKALSKEEYIKEAEALDSDFAHKKITQDQWQTSQNNLESRYNNNGIVDGYSGFFVSSYDVRYDLLPPDTKGNPQPLGIPHYFIVVAVGDKTLPNVRGKIAPLSISQSYPDPSKYTIDPADPTYPVHSNTSDGEITSGWALRHEFGHSALTNDQFGVRPLPHPKVDWLALQRLKDAYGAYKKGDNSLYYFVFRKNGQDIYTDVAQKDISL